MRQLSPKITPWLNQFNQQMAVLEANGYKPTCTNIREGLAYLTAVFVTDIPKIAWVQDDLVKSTGYPVPVRIYHPSPDHALPVLVYFHGGGHMAGSITVYDAICRKIAQAAKHIVISVDYRLAPECPYPAAVEDAYHVVKNIWHVLDDRKLNYLPQLSIGGDSAGGALSATVANKLQFEPNTPLHAQVLIYPSLDYTLSSASVVENGVGNLLSTKKVTWYFNHYFQHQEDRKTASPLFAEFSNKLPPTLVISAEFCPLRDEGIDYLAKLKKVGVATDHLHFSDLPHTFLNLENLVKEECQRTYQSIGAWLNLNKSI
ncbi:alpha/beta hydrolase [Iodobacter fluviatilis]|uniref:Alpha/beta hydrolase n=1 Tax=Iodobacter fluviatilis TaxID=537 RepID=A0A7G3GEE5_9NEIS|nr:alpha/beta hydrolase [Iodobacter fluviatilis]QBC45499.1 alpha/beta hydrolase [Iodobacter fluviatilis]